MHFICRMVHCRDDKIIIASVKPQTQTTKILVRYPQRLFSGWIVLLFKAK